MASARVGPDRESATFAQSPIWVFCCRRSAQNPPEIRANGTWDQQAVIGFPTLYTPPSETYGHAGRRNAGPASLQRDAAAPYPGGENASGIPGHLRAASVSPSDAISLHSDPHPQAWGKTQLNFAAARAAGTPLV